MKNISIIIPIKNGEKKIKSVFTGLESLKFPRELKLAEVIFVDDGSRDKTFSTLVQASQESSLPTAIFTYKKTLGTKLAIKFGIANSKSKINIVTIPNLSNLDNALNRLNRKTKKKREPLVSIVMPVYNAEKYLEMAIESILKQTYKHWELIIINDNSSDNSLKIMKSYKRRLRKKLTILQTDKTLNRGGDMCANLGIEKARGKYIARMDADDIAMPERIEKQVEFLEKNKRVFLVGSSAVVINTKGKVMGEKKVPCKPSDIYRSYATFHPIIHPTAMLRRVFKNKNFSYQIKYSANNDYYTFFKLMCKGYIFVNLDENLLYYRIHDKNDTFMHMRNKYINTLKIRCAMMLHYRFHLTTRDIAINIAQAVLMLTLPESIAKNLYLFSKGIIKPKFINLPLFGRLPAPSI